jgi:hypothetical protein
LRLNGDDRLPGDAKVAGRVVTQDTHELAFDIWSKKATGAQRSLSEYPVRVEKQSHFLHKNIVVL